VKVIDGGAELEEKQVGKKLLRIRITAEVDGVLRDYTTTFGRCGKNDAAVGRAYARADTPGGRQEDAKRIAALVKALTGEEPKVYPMKYGRLVIVCDSAHLENFKRYKELVGAIEKWLEETGQ